MNWKWLAGALVPMVLALLAAACGDDGDDPGTEPTRRSPGTATATPGNEIVAALRKLDAPLELADGLALGRPEAKVTLAVFEDFQCPHCLRFTALIEPSIVEEYVKPGKVRLEFRNLPFLGPESVQAALAAWCAGEQNQFWPYQEKLFMVQAEAGQATSEKLDVGRYSTEKLQEHASALGLDRAAFDACYTSEAAAEGVRGGLREAQSLGLRGTPSFVIDGQPLADSPASLAVWRKVLDEALAK